MGIYSQERPPIMKGASSKTGSRVVAAPNQPGELAWAAEEVHGHTIVVRGRHGVCLLEDVLGEVDKLLPQLDWPVPFLQTE
jgi:hypothetical protein